MTRWKIEIDSELDFWKLRKIDSICFLIFGNIWLLFFGGEVLPSCFLMLRLWLHNTL